MRKPLNPQLGWILLGLATAMPLPLRAMEDPHAAGHQGVTVTTLVRSDRSWNGTQLPPYPSGQPEVTVLRIRIPAGVALPQHLHPVINAGVLLKGRLKVITDRGQTKVLAAGDGLIEVVNQLHAGRSLGPGPAEIVVVYAGVKGLPNTVEDAPAKPGL